MSRFENLERFEERMMNLRLEREGPAGKPNGGDDGPRAFEAQAFERFDGYGAPRIEGIA